MERALKERFRGIVDSARFAPGALSSSIPLLRGGGMGRPYFSFDLWTSDPGALLLAAEAYIHLIAGLKRLRPLDLLAFIKKSDQDDNSGVGAVKLAGLICTDDSIWLPHVDVRLGRDLPADRINLPTARNREAALEDERVAVITDHVSRGDELYEAVTVLRSYGANVTDAITFSVWEDLFAHPVTGFKARFEAAGVQFHAIATLKEIPDSNKADLVFNELLDIPTEAPAASARA